MINYYISGFPQFGIKKIDHWPSTAPVIPIANDDNNTTNTDSDTDVDIMDIDEENENVVPSEKPYCTLVQYSQLKLLLRQCHYCGHTIYEQNLILRNRNGITTAKFWCNHCKRRRYWKSFDDPLPQLITGATMMSGIEIAQILRFFSILQCVFPSRRTIFYAAQIVIRPLIQEFYKLKQHNILNEIIERKAPIHLCIDSPGYSAYHCTVTAIESVSKKIIAFSTIKKLEVNKKLCNADTAAFRVVLDFIFSKNIQISSVASDNTSALNKMFAVEYPNIRHHLDLWHILRNMYNKFSPKFKLKVCLFKFILV